jgi:prepilin-type N-terminal cleavage/methylation domain-containing protein
MRRRAGFSLVEVLCAIAILGIAVAGMTRGLATALASTRESEQQTTASLIAAGQIELLRADGFIVEGEDEGECGAELSNYIWKQSVTSSAIDGLYEVTVTVQHARTGQEIYELKTMLFDPPLLSTEEPADRNRNSRSGNRRRR